MRSEVVLLAELRRGLGIRVALPLIALGLAASFNDIAAWRGDWLFTSVQAQSVSFVLGPVAAGIAAAAGSRDARTGFTPIARVTARARAGSAAVQWIALAFILMLSYLAIVAAVSAATALATGVVRPWPSYLVIGAAHLLAASAIGFIVGVLTRSLFAAPAVALAIFSALVLCGNIEGRGRALFLYYGDAVPSPARVIAPVVLAGQLLFCLGIVALCWFLICLRDDLSFGITTFSWVGCLVSVCALVLAVGAVFSTNIYQARDSGSVDPVCAGRAPRVCVWPEHAKWLPDAVVVAGNLDNALRGIYTYPGVVYEQGLGAEPASPQVVLDTVPVTRVGMVVSLSSPVLPAPPSRCVRENSDLFDRYVLALAWLQTKASGEVSPGVKVDSQKLSQLLSRPPAAQASWMAQTVTAIRACQ